MPDITALAQFTLHSAPLELTISRRITLSVVLILTCHVHVQNFNWMRTLNGSFMDECNDVKVSINKGFVYAIAVDVDNNFLVVSVFDCSIDFDPADRTESIQTATNSNAFSW
jgi:hypothetical protein